MNDIPKIFRYNKVVPKCPYDCLISPSSLARLYTNPGEWYDMAVLNKPNPFHGNDATVTGTICHHKYECIANGTIFDDKDVYNQLIDYAKVMPELELDVDKVFNDAITTSDVVYSTYTGFEYNNAIVELETLKEVADGIFIGGHVDRIEGNVVIDFKTVSKKPNEEKIPLRYKLQLMAYVAALNNDGFNIDTIRIVYGVKPTKTLPARCVVVTETIEDEHIQLIEYTINLIRSSIEKCKADPTLVPLIFRNFEVTNMY